MVTLLSHKSRKSVSSKYTKTCFGYRKLQWLSRSTYTTIEDIGSDPGSIERGQYCVYVV